jgi:hypothetical protein
MSWSQDVIVSVLFPYLLPSLPVFDQECWLPSEFQSLLEHLLVLLANDSLETTHLSLEMFIKRTFSAAFHVVNIRADLCFLANIRQRSSFDKLDSCKSDAHSLYASMLLIENKADVHVNDDFALIRAYEMGFGKTIDFLEKHKCDSHHYDKLDIMWATIKELVY